ncbi:hypothetical protein AX761_21920 [Rhizobium sp. 58]|nr:hypothetical protein AX761_21920 [Rhizobium sp. 58]
MIPIGVDYDKVMREDARLIILRALHEQINESLPSTTLDLVLQSFVIRQTRAWIHGEMEYLRSMGAITILDAGSVKIGTLTELGLRHLMRETIIEGVKRPTKAVK